MEPLKGSLYETPDRILWGSSSKTVVTTAITPWQKRLIVGLWFVQYLIITYTIGETGGTVSEYVANMTFSNV